MIRVSRPATPPAALAQSKVQAFITELAAHKNDPATTPRPARPSGYRTSDLLEMFDTHFYAKCYLTEQKFASAWEMDVDHLEPVASNPGRVLDWTNLYPADHKANIMRGNYYPTGGLLDPCADAVESELRYTLVEQGEKPGFHAADESNIKAVNTAHLLDVIHNGRPSSPASHKSTIHLRYLIEKRYKTVLETWGEYGHATDDQSRLEAEDQLRVLLSRKSSFTMLMRSIPCIRKTVSHLFD
jgi:hypothetical protein